MPKQTVNRALKYMVLAASIAMASFFFSGDVRAQSQAREESLAIAERCTKYTEPEVSFLRINGGVYYSPALTEEVLASQKSRLYGEKMPDFQGNLGEPDINFKTVVYIDRFPTTGCVYLKKLHLEVRVDHRVYIAGEYPEGSCLYNEFYQLETELMQLDQDIINERIEEIKAYITSVPEEIRALGPNRKGSIYELEAKHRKNINAIINSEIMQLKKDLLYQRRENDDPQFYYDIYADCGLEPPE